MGLGVHRVLADDVVAVGEDASDRIASLVFSLAGGAGGMKGLRGAQRNAVAASGGGTHRSFVAGVAWKMQGRKGWVGKALSLVFDREQRVGPSFERGLTDLKAVANQKANDPANE